jgi:hypothetical protein
MTVTETVTLPKAEYDALLDRLEDAEDALTIRQFRTTVRELGWEEATKDCLPAELVERKLKGEHPVRIWREHRKLSLRALGERAHIPASTISQIENTLKPGSVSAYSKTARALDLPIDAVLPEIVD